MTPIVRTSALETEMTYALNSVISLSSNTEDYSIISVTHTHITIVDFNDETKLIPNELVLELSDRAYIPFEVSFDLIATLVSKRNPGDMTIEILLPLLENRTVEEVKELLAEYGDSDSAYLIETITEPDILEDEELESVDDERSYLIYDLTETIQADITMCMEDLKLLKSLLSHAKTNVEIKNFSKEILELKKRIKNLKRTLKNI